MTIVHGYCDADELTDRLKITTAANIAPVDDIITSVSREIDAHCHRRFWADTALTTRDCPLISDDMQVVYCDDVADTATAVVKTDLTGNGSYSTTLTAGTDFVWEPLGGARDGLEGLPADQIRKFAEWTSVVFPVFYSRARVQITAKWGWAAVPYPVKQACLLLASETYKLQEAPFGVAGFGEFGVVRVRDMPQAERMLFPYQKEMDGTVGW